MCKLMKQQKGIVMVMICRVDDEKGTEDEAKDGKEESRVYLES